MAKKTIRVPVTVHNGVQYVAPGTEVEMDEREADALIARHGEWGGNTAQNDPANTNVLNALDHSSIESLNTIASIQGGHGKNALKQGETAEDRANSDAAKAKEPLPEDNVLKTMTHTELKDLASERGVSVGGGDSKAEIIAKLKAAE